MEIRKMTKQKLRVLVVGGAGYIGPNILAGGEFVQGDLAERGQLERFSSGRSVFYLHKHTNS